MPEGSTDIPAVRFRAIQLVRRLFHLSERPLPVNIGGVGFTGRRIVASSRGFACIARPLVSNPRRMIEVPTRIQRSLDVYELEELALNVGSVIFTRISLRAASCLHAVT
jgi:hypothetical protein